MWHSSTQYRWQGVRPKGAAPGTGRASEYQSAKNALLKLGSIIVFATRCGWLKVALVFHPALTFTSLSLILSCTLFGRQPRVQITIYPVTKKNKKKKLRNSHSHLHSQLRNLPKLRLGKLFAKSSTNFSALLWLLCIASTRIKVFTAVTYLYLLQTNILCGLKGGLRVWVAAVLQISRFAIINNASF